MAKGTDFGGVHSHQDLNLIQQKVDIQPAEPKLNLIDVPGADGSVDMTELPAGRVVYKDRILTWTYALYPGDDWHARHRKVSNALNGKRCRIILDDDPGRYYMGRLSVKKYNTDRVLRQITVEATCSPWIFKKNPTVITENLIHDSTGFMSIILSNEKKPAIPTIEVTRNTTIVWKGSTKKLAAGASFTSLDIELQEGDNLLKAASATSDGAITITYQEASL